MPAFYHKERVGLNGRTFPVHKFRSLRQAAEARPGDASEVASEEYRGWLLSVFADLAEAAGARDAKQLARQLLLLYDGAAVAARMDEDRRGAAIATGSGVIALLEAAIP